MTAYWSYFAVFLLSFVGLGLFYHNTRRNRIISFYFLLFAFTTYSVLCNFYFNLPQNGYFIAFYVAQSWFVFSSILNNKKAATKKVRQPVHKKKRIQMPVSVAQEEKKQYMAQ